MTQQKDLPALKVPKTGQRAKAMAGALVVFAVIVMTVNGVAALKNEKDTSGAMKLPAALAFVYAQKKTLPQKAPNQHLRATALQTTTRLRPHVPDHNR